jgi:hypothetical protein
MGKVLPILDRKRFILLTAADVNAFSCRVRAVTERQESSPTEVKRAIRNASSTVVNEKASDRRTLVT